MRTALIIMAAGIGSRFKTGIKQLTKVDDAGHIIMDYSVHDAVKAGFSDIVFVIRREIEVEFRSIIGDRIEAVCKKTDIKVHYAFQSLSDIPCAVPEGRTKPWGTGQAVLCARPLIDMPFAVINADDYYGTEAFRLVRDHLAAGGESCCVAGFVLKNTLSENGAVTRGICEAENGFITSITETRRIIKTETGIEADGKPLNPESTVSMNMWGFAPSFMEKLEKGFAAFLSDTVPSNPLTAEFLLPEMVGKLLKSREITVKALLSPDNWLGMTYIEDADRVRKGFAALIAEGKYTPDLFSDI